MVLETLAGHRSAVRVKQAQWDIYLQLIWPYPNQTHISHRCGCAREIAYKINIELNIKKYKK